MRNASGTPVGTFQIADVPIGGGGYTLQIDIHPTSGRKWVGTDVSNAYVRDTTDTKWTTLFRNDVLPAGDLVGNDGAKTDGYGSYFGKFALSDHNRLYSQFNGWVYTIDIDPAKKVSEAGAMTATRWNLGVKQFKTNNSLQRWWGPGVAIHPTDKAIAIVGTNNDGVYYTQTSGATVTAVTIGANSGGNGFERYLVWIDQGNGNYVYIFRQGTGLYRSTAGVSGAFTLVTGGPTASSCLFGEADGTLWIVADPYIVTGGIYRLARGAATTISSLGVINGHAPLRLAVDPNNANHIVVGEEQWFAVSLDRAATWVGGDIVQGTGNIFKNRTGEVNWNTGVFVSHFAFDPLTANKAWVSDGEGVSFINNVPNSSSPVTFSLTDASAGIEELIARRTIAVPSTGKLYMSHWDHPVATIKSLTRYTNFPNSAAGTGIQIGGQIDYAIDDPEFAVSASGQGVNRYQYTTNGGRKWTLFDATLFPGSGGSAGSCAIGNKNNIIIAPSNNQTIVYTKDGGLTWIPITLGGVTPVNIGSSAYYVTRWNVTADKTRPGKFAMVLTIIGGPGGTDNPLGGVWYTADGGDTWAQKLTGIISEGSDHSYATITASGQENRQFWQCQLEYVPGRSSELLYTPHGDYADDKIFTSTDDGQTWTNPNTLVRNVSQFGFGKALIGQSRPAVYFLGKVSGVLGYWVTFDWFATFTLVSNLFPQNVVGSPSFSGADITVFGRCFFDISGKGSYYSSFVDTAMGT